MATLRGINARSEYTEEIEQTEKTVEIDRKIVSNHTYSMSVHDTYTFLHEGDLHVSYGSKIFLKKVDFDIIVHNLNAVEKKLISASPELSGIGMIRLNSVEGVFFQSQLKASPSQNMLTCHQHGRVLDMRTMTSHGIRLEDTVMLSDSFLINRDRMSCTILDASWTDIHCITRLRDVGLVTGMKLETNDTGQYYRKLVNMQLENTVLYLMANRTHIWLDNAPISQVICAVGQESGEKAIDQFDVARKKHFSLLGKAMIDWTEYLSIRLYSLSDLYYLMASPESPAVTQTTGRSCKTLSSMDFQECNINTQLSFQLSRRFLEENRKKIYDVDNEISRIKKFATENCGNNDQIVSAMVGILAELKIEIMHKWEIDELLADIFRIPVVTVGDWDIVKCAQESTHQILSELEAVWKVYVMHNFIQFNFLRFISF